MQIGLLSDTHGFLDEAIFHHFAECDEVWHAGDFGSLEILNRLRDFKLLRGVYGNIDDALLRTEVPRDLAWECEGVSVYMTHIGGSGGKELKGLRPGLFICGHSHILKVMGDPALGLLHRNRAALDEKTSARPGDGLLWGTARDLIDRYKQVHNRMGRSVEFAKRFCLRPIIPVMSPDREVHLIA